MRSNRRTPVVPGRSARRVLAAVAVLGTVIAAEVTTATASDAVSGGRNPVGQVSNLVQDGNGFQLRGWAYDADTSAPTTVKVKLDGKSVVAVKANVARADVQQAHPGYGPNRGFAAHWNTAVGTHEVCAYAVNFPSTATYSLGCRTVTITHNPIGAINWLTPSPGFIRAMKPSSICPRRRPIAASPSSRSRIRSPGTCTATRSPSRSRRAPTRSA